MPEEAAHFATLSERLHIARVVERVVCTPDLLLRTCGGGCGHWQRRRTATVRVSFWAANEVGDRFPIPSTPLRLLFDVIVEPKHGGQQQENAYDRTLQCSRGIIPHPLGKSREP